jgi:S-formylglutathione hydrolase
MSQSPQLQKEHQCFGGSVGFYSHRSWTCNSVMKFSVYQPPQAKSELVPVLYFLSGLTCTEENFMIKAGAQQFAAKYGLMLVAPDTSPRNIGIVGEDAEWDLGSGASFYVDAIAGSWKSNYQMYSYIVDELPALISENFPVIVERQGILGHSMGGHGALICALRNPKRYLSVSAFSPIVAPMQCPWGQKAFRHYLGEDQELWRNYDASELVKKKPYHSPILIDYGTDDPYLAEGQLLPDIFVNACAESGQELILRMQTGYDHSYYFISTFIKDHLLHHAEALCG